MSAIARLNLGALPLAYGALAILGVSFASCTGVGPAWLAMAIVAACLLLGWGVAVKPRAAAIACGGLAVLAGVLFLVERRLVAPLAGQFMAAAADLGRALRVALAGGTLLPTPAATVLLFAAGGVAVCLPIAWALVRRHDALWLFVAGQVALAIEWAFYYDRALTHLFWFDVFALGAIAASAAARRHVARPAGRHERLIVRAAAWAMLATVIVGFLAMFLPNSFAPWRLDRLGKALTEVLPVLERGRGQVGGVHAFTVQAVGSSQSAEEIGGPIGRRTGVALRVRLQGDLPRGDNIYLRGTVLTRYTGRGWRAAEHWTAADVGTPLPTSFAAAVPRGYLYQDIEPAEAWTTTLFASLEPVRVDVRGGRYLFNEEGALAVRAAPPRSYAVTSRVAPVSAEHLRRLVQADSAAAGGGEALERCLQLTPELPERVLALARDVTAAASDDLERAELLEAFVRQFPYVDNVPRTPPGRDLVDYFLFDLRQGYCVHHSTALVVLLRACGIPARWVQGFLCPPPGRPGEVVEVPSDNEHAWAEAFFPGYGWLVFEATPAYATPARDAPAPPPPHHDTPSGGVTPAGPPGGHELPEEPGNGLAPGPRRRASRALPLAAAALGAALAVAGIGRVGWALFDLRRREAVSAAQPRPAVRRCFALAEELLASGGAARAVDLTPLEYARAAAVALPGRQGDALRGLADAYCRARYTAGDLDAGAAERAIGLWRLLRAEARRDWGAWAFWWRRLFRRGRHRR